MRKFLFWFLFIIMGLSNFGEACARMPLPVDKADTLKSQSAGKAYIIKLSTDQAPVLPENFDALLRFNFYGICWNGTIDDNLRYAKHMGFSYVFYQPGMENNSLASDLFFYLESPEYKVYNTLGAETRVYLDREYTETQKNIIQSNFALKITTSAFPDNIARGYPYPSLNAFVVQPDYQQQRVLDHFVTQVTLYSKKIDKPDKKFLFGGLAWDVPQFEGDLWAPGHNTSLAYWNGKDSSALFSGCTHEYNTYSEAKVSYNLALRKSLKTEYPDRTLTYIYEPFRPYDNWAEELEKLPYETQVNLMENALVSQEGGRSEAGKRTGTEFVDDPRVYKTGIIKKDRTASTTPDNHDLVSNLFIAERAAINGAWFNWFGRIGGSGDKVPMNNIYEVPNWLQLIRVVANWDNLNGISIANRNLNGSVYTSTNSRMDENVIYSRQPKTQKLFVVFLNNTGEITLNPGEKVVSVNRVNNFFIETADGKSDLLITENKIKIR